MMSSADNNMNAKKSVQLTNCQKQIKVVVDNLRGILDQVSNPPGSMTAEQRASWEADICLASRSAYFDFYTWVVLNGMIDPPAERELDELFQRSLAAMEPGQFKDSVQARYNEFKAKCASVPVGFASPAASSM